MFFYSKYVWKMIELSMNDFLQQRWRRDKFLSIFARLPVPTGRYPVEPFLFGCVSIGKAH